MKFKAVLFDLDGTLLPMDQDVFVKAYFGGLTKKLLPYGFEPNGLIKAVWKGTEAMILNDGKVSNETAFWNLFAEIYGEEVRNYEPIFASFYENEFQQVKNVCGKSEKAAEVIKLLKYNGITVALATNPIFPEIATKSRVEWAGLNVEDFSLITTYENSCYSKPNTKYYLEIAKKLNIDPRECLMVGNDVGDDMTAADVGFNVFLLTDNLINKKGTDISVFQNGDFNELIDFLK